MKKDQNFKECAMRFLVTRELILRKRPYITESELEELAGFRITSGLLEVINMDYRFGVGMVNNELIVLKLEAK